MVFLQHVEDLLRGYDVAVGLVPYGESHGGYDAEIHVADGGLHGESSFPIEHGVSVFSEILLEVDTVPYVLPGIICVDDAADREVYGSFDGRAQRKSGLARTDEGRAEDVPCSVIVSRDLGSHDHSRLARLIVLIDRTEKSLLEADSRENDALGPENLGLIQHLVDVFAGVRAGTPFQFEHQAQLGQVGHYDVGLLAELAHACREVGAEHSVELALVGHHGIHVDRGGFMGQFVEQIAY